MTELQPSSVIVPTRSRPDLVLATVRSILTGAAVPRELIVVDQSPEAHPTLTELGHGRACDVRYIHSTTVGVSAARNVGVEAARYEILVLTDDDVLVAPGWLERLVSALVDAGPRSVMTGKVLPGEPEAAGSIVLTDRLTATPWVLQGRPGRDPLLVISAALYRSALEDVGGFDERLGPGTHFGGGEDSDLGFRLLEAGYRIVYVPEAELVHRAWRSPDAILRLRWHYGRGQGAFYAKHASLADRYTLGRMAKEAGRLVRAFPRRLVRSRRRALGDAAYVAGLLSGALGWWLGPGRSRRG